MRRAVDRRGPKPIHRSGHPEFVELVAEDPLLFLERGQRLFAEGDVPTCMYIVKTGQLQIRSGGVIYEDVGPGGIIGEMGVIETQELRSATVYALTDSELVESMGAADRTGPGRSAVSQDRHGAWVSIEVRCRRLAPVAMWPGSLHQRRADAQP